MRLGFRWCLSAVISFAAVTSDAKELWERRWIEVKTPHFKIVSAIPEARSVALANELEAFRSAVEIITNIGRFEDRVPTFVYVLPHSVKALGFSSGIVGWFDAEMRANYALVIPSTQTPLDDVLKHEYVHFLLHNRDERSYPTWFDEGFAELLATITVREGTIDYGLPPKGRIPNLMQLNWLPFDRLLRTNDIWRLTPVQQAAFYAQSWLLTHYLMNSEQIRWQAASASFLGSVDQGVEPTVAFERAFGINVAGLKPKLANYIDDLRYMRMRLKQPLPVPTTTTAEISKESIATQLGNLYLTRSSTDHAKRAWEAALAFNPNNVVALVGLGDLLKFESKFEDAHPYYEKAIALDPDNAYSELDFAEYFSDRARAQKDPATVAADLAEARRHFARSFKLDPNVPETLAMNGETYLIDGTQPAKAVGSLTLAHQMLPSHGGIRYMLAKAHAKNNDTDDAIRLLRSVIAWGHAADSTEEARALLQQLTQTATTTSTEDSQAAQ